MLQTKREAACLPSGDWRITVTPPTFLGFKPSTIVLSPDQYRRFIEWVGSGVKIQDALPDLTAGQREILLSGIGEAEFDAAFGDDE